MEENNGEFKIPLELESYLKINFLQKVLQQYPLKKIFI
jgi:hypothetical protein